MEKDDMRDGLVTQWRIQNIPTEEMPVKVVWDRGRQP